jgi:hypothetical protein
MALLVWHFSLTGSLLIVTGVALLYVTPSTNVKVVYSPNPLGTKKQLRRRYTRQCCFGQLSRKVLLFATTVRHPSCDLSRNDLTDDNNTHPALRMHRICQNKRIVTVPVLCGRQCETSCMKRCIV